MGMVREIFQEQKRSNDESSLESVETMCFGLGKDHVFVVDNNVREERDKNFELELFHWKKERGTNEF